MYVCECMCVRVSGVVVRGCIVLLGTASIHIENESDGCLDCYSPGKNPCLTCYLKPPTGKFREGRPGRAGASKNDACTFPCIISFFKQGKEMKGIFDDMIHPVNQILAQFSMAFNWVPTILIGLDRYHSHEKKRGSDLHFIQQLV